MPTGQLPIRNRKESKLASSTVVEEAALKQTAKLRERMQMFHKSLRRLWEMSLVVAV
jgi:hypothetical protein